jgi:hypothetical protein
MTFKNLSLALCSLFLISCGSGDSGPKAASSRAEKRGTQAVRAEGTPSKAGALKPGDRTWGRIFIDEGFQSGGQVEFQEKVNLLLEPQFKADEVGEVIGLDDSQLSNNEKSETGIAFWGKGLTLTGGLDPNKTDYSEQTGIFDESTASLRVSIFSKLIDSANPGVSIIRETPIHFNDGIEPGVDSGKLVDSYIKNNEVQLIFADQYGKFSLHGTFNNNNFSGNVYFKTDKIDQDDSGAVDVDRKPQYLGKFSVITCGFFTCTN